MDTIKTKISFYLIALKENCPKNAGSTIPLIITFFRSVASNNWAEFLPCSDRHQV